MDKGRNIQYLEEERGILTRIEPVNGAVHILCLCALRQRVLFLGHYAPLSGHKEITKQYYKQRRTFYWPTMLSNVRWYSNNCHQCARERIQIKKHEEPLELFRESSLIEYVAIDIL